MKNYIKSSSFIFLMGFTLSLYSYAEKNLEQDQYPSSAVWKIEIPKTRGTGFFISPNLFVANFHLIQKIPQDFHLDQITLSQETHSRLIHIKNIQNLSALDDLLILETKESVKDYLTIEEKPPKSLKNLSTIGYPKGQWAKMKQTEGKPFYQDKFLFLIPVNRIHLAGASGAPVLNQKNQVVGIVSLRFYNIIYAIKIDRLQKLIRENYKISSINAYDSIKQEITNLKSLARKGNSRARSVWSLSNYSSAKQDVKQTLDWLIEDEKQEYAPNLFYLAKMYLKGVGVEKNFEKALLLYKKSEKQGFIEAQYTIAAFYLIGKGVKQNDEQAIYWYKKAAEQGLIVAQYSLGVMYSVGRGVEKNSEKAVYWLKQAVEQGYLEAQKELDKISSQSANNQCKKVFLLKKPTPVF